MHTPCISSDDGAYIIELGEPMQSHEKHSGEVGVYHGKLLKSPHPVDVEAEAAKKLGHLAKYLRKGDDQQVSRASMQAS